ncbi:aldolase/citrate lyase family protein [Halodesulfovibrio marinisediminis]|uniref:HpcH/HpaI aldolase/citrate lyase family protein n=1 Tax=Halodesulfovibrio marinisediminis DSM 17456 TaxID=1121457 RepID=A0A1N6FSM1_9BACT|nr:aldolase/citrate lyase family protein [Halodesulfovibrio marinisediminis]SIN98319.1 HpcH/HpaI aldolase/citrate lyase family protein [Halodesulfovibrio marinisediminis DSM 17456]
MFNYLFITNKAEIASFAERCGVTRIFVDLERKGKLKRQGHLDTVISKHSFEDINSIKKVLSKAELMVRLNPLHADSKNEVEKAIEAGCDIIMLPMFRTAQEVATFGGFIRGRAKLIPLVETCGAAESIESVVALDCVNEVHIGLNDLHLDLQLNFMFELLANGYVEALVKKIHKPFGIGGIARVGDGIIPGEIVMAEHVRLGSAGVILSRAFHLRSETLEQLTTQIDLKSEIEKLEAVRKKYMAFDENELQFLHNDFCKRIQDIVG